MTDPADLERPHIMVLAPTGHRYMVAKTIAEAYELVTSGKADRVHVLQPDDEP